ncbi:MAG: hypothetical protein PHU14_12060 [Methylovulum sp.]|nr:hypothetical protein [Methylovulum sp.]
MRTPLIIALFACTALLVYWAHDTHPITAKDIRFAFVKPPVVPVRGVPKEADCAGLEPDPNGNKGGRSGISFSVVLDPDSHGSLASVVANRISAITVMWSDHALLKTAQDTEDFLRRLLTTRTGSTYTYIPWAQGLGTPHIAARVQHTEGKSGQWLVWYGWPSVYCAYQDGAGKWWFGVWFHDEDARLEPKKHEAQ